MPDESQDQLARLLPLANRLAMPTRPELRRPRRMELATYRVRVDLDHAAPPIWRRLDVRSDLTLDLLHQILQTAFDWTDSHLHRFSLGGGPFDWDSQLFLCSYDVEEGEFEEDGNIAASDVRLDETLQDPGDVLRYVYDYGASWELTLRLEEVLPAATDTPSAVAVDGRRAAPPDDCGGMTDAESLAEVLNDPAHFDLDELNQALRSPYVLLLEASVDQRLVALVNRLRSTDLGADLAARVISLSSEPTTLSPDDTSRALRAHRWFLDRAAEGGLPLTSAGYMKPADVEVAARVVPAVHDRIGKNNRETHLFPLLELREWLRSSGLIRKYKDTLVLTKAGAAARVDPPRLWDVFAQRLLEVEDGFETDATLLYLAYAASSPDGVVPLETLARALSHLGWQHRDGRDLQHYELYGLPVMGVLENVTETDADRHRRVSPAAATLARAALRWHP